MVWALCRFDINLVETVAHTWHRWVTAVHWWLWTQLIHNTCGNRIGADCRQLKRGAGKNREESSDLCRVISIKISFYQTEVIFEPTTLDSSYLGYIPKRPIMQHTHGDIGERERCQVQQQQPSCPPRWSGWSRVNFVIWYDINDMIWY